MIDDTNDARASAVGITAVGVYVPRVRIAASSFRDAWGQFDAPGVDRKAVPGADEDTLTMAIEAGTRALAAASLGPDAVDWIGFGTATPPLAEGALSTRLGAMLGLDSRASQQLFTGSTRAGTRALWAAMAFLESADGATTDDSSRALVIAADAPRGDPAEGIDHAAGAGAVAFVLERGSGLTIVDRAEYAAPYPGTRFRRSGENETQELGVTAYERGAFAETIGAAVDGLESGSPEAVDAVAVQAPDGKRPYRVAGRIGVDTAAIQRCATVHDLGDLGAASVPASIVSALESGDESILAVAYGSGAGADALVLERTGDEDVPVGGSLEVDGDTESITYSQYLRQRGVVAAGPPNGGGAYVSVPTWKRSLPQRYRLVAGRCLACDNLAFPSEGACPDCHRRDGFADVELDGTGDLEAVTTIQQGGAPPEFAEFQSRSGPYAAVIVALEGPDGGCVRVPAMGTDADPDVFAVGDRVEATIRRLYTQEDVTRYGFKVRPLRPDSDTGQ